MNNQKSALKMFIEQETQKSMQSTHNDDYLKYYRRVSSICRAAVNRLSYDLRFDNGKISLLHDTREIVIEQKTRNLELSEKAFNAGTALLALAKDKSTLPEVAMS